MLIRKAVPEDFEALIAIGHKFFEFNAYRKYTSLDAESLRHTLFKLYKKHILLVVEVDNKIVGTAAAFVGPLYWNHDYLQGLEAFWWIDPEHRSNGAGTLLRIALQNTAYNMGVSFWNMAALKESMHDEVCAQYQRNGMTHVETVYMKVL